LSETDEKYVLSADDEMEYGLSIEATNGVWVKASVKTRVRQNESPLECWQRASQTVDALIKMHADRLAKELS